MLDGFVGVKAVDVKQIDRSVVKPAGCLIKAVRKNYFSNLDDDDGAKWSSSNPARPSEA